MKNLLFIAIAVLVLSCGEEPATKTYKGNFLATQDAAVLDVNEQMYAVTMDDMAAKLAQQIKASQGSEHDMVPVEIQAIVKAKPANTEGWDSIITIKKIVSVSATAVGPDIKLEETKQ